MIGNQFIVGGFSTAMALVIVASTNAMAASSCPDLSGRRIFFPHTRCSVEQQTCERQPTASATIVGSRVLLTDSNTGRQDEGVVFTMGETRELSEQEMPLWTRGRTREGLATRRVLATATYNSSRLRLELKIIETFVDGGSNEGVFVTDIEIQSCSRCSLRERSIRARFVVRGNEHLRNWEARSGDCWLEPVSQ